MQPAVRHGGLRQVTHASPATLAWLLLHISEMLFRMSKQRTSMMLALEGKIRVTVFSEMLFRTSRQRGSNTCYTWQRVPCYLRNAVQDKQAKRNKYDTCFGGRRRARSEPLSSQKCCSGQAGKERTSRHLFNRQGEGKMKELGDAIVVFSTRTRLSCYNNIPTTNMPHITSLLQLLGWALTLATWIPNCI